MSPACVPSSGCISSRTVGLRALIMNDPSLLGALPAELPVKLAGLTRLDTISIDQTLSRGDLRVVLPALPALTSVHFWDLGG